MSEHRPSVIFDIDGVLCDCSQALHDFIQTKPTEDDWNDTWFPSMGEHAPHHGWMIMASLLKESNSIILLTNRPERIRAITEAWLDAHKIEYDLLIMRPKGTRYSQGKRERLEELISKYSVVLAIDDDPMQVAVFREAGIPVIHVQNNLDATFEGTL